MSPPPGYVAYGDVGARGSFKRIGGLAKSIVILQIASVVLSVVLIAVQAALVGKANDFLDGDISRTSFRNSMQPFFTVSFVLGLVSIASVVVLIIWSYRIAGNLQNLGRAPLTWTPGKTIVVWLLGGCTLSIINFFMLREHWRGSDPEVRPGDPSWRTRPVSGLIVAWFVLAILQLVAAGASGARSFSGVNLGNSTTNLADSLSDRLPYVIVSGLLGLVAALLMIGIVRQMTARHV
ncbi:MAG: hypothetical protein JWN99_2723, partial [Ilumatobacteraceae bacterium]|nr:hypothetical protein [Ilumatobacteraceae bacterium]